MKQLIRHKGYVLLGLIVLLAFVGGISIAGASPADCSASTELTGTLTQSGNTVTGKADNCSSADANVGLVVIAAFVDGNGNINNREYNRVTGTVNAGETLDLVTAVPECTIKVVLYKGNDENVPGNQLARAVYNVAPNNYCTDNPTPTPTSPPPTATKTPQPTKTPTPLPPTVTPTPLPPTATPPPPTPTTPPPTPTTPPPTPTEPAGGQGCTPGYWKQAHHFDSWVNYSPAADYEAVFGVDASFNKDLVGALRQGGGGEKALGRHAVAALLNSVNAGVSYAYTEADVIAMVQSAYASGNFEGIKNLFETENELGCPLN